MAQFQSAKLPRSLCRTCGKPIVVLSTRGRGSVGYCSRICASLARFEKRYTGSRSGIYGKPENIMEKAKV
jgi:hypothetical protein